MTEVEERLRETLRHYAERLPAERPRLEDLALASPRPPAGSVPAGLVDRVRSAWPTRAPVRPRRVWVGAMVAAAVLVLAAAAVGVRLADQGPTVSVMDAAAVELGRAVAYEMTLTVEYVDAQRSGLSTSLITSGVADFSTGDGQATTRIVTDGYEVVTETLRIGDALYMRYTALPGVIADEIPQAWVRMAIPSSTPGLATGAATGLQVVATSVIELLQAGTDLEETGTEETRGIRTTRYLLRVDSLTLRAFFNGMDPDRYERMLRAMGRGDEVAALREGRPTVQAWIDDDSRLRRLVTEERMQGANMTVDLVITDYDVALRLERPEEFEVHRPDQAEDSLPESAPVGARPDGVPEDLAPGLPFPRGARLVEIERDGATTELTLEVRAPDGDQREYAELVGNLYAYPPDAATWRAAGISTGSSSSGDEPTREWSDIKLVGPNWAGQVRVEWQRGDAITLFIEVTGI